MYDEFFIFILINISYISVNMAIVLNEKGFVLQTIFEFKEWSILSTLYRN